ncbi:MAG: hypothetical protein VB135_00005 [Burkholderia sp.]
MAGNNTFRMPPAPPQKTEADLQAFLDQAPDRRDGQPKAAASVDAAPAAAATPSTALPWEGKPDSRRTPIQPLRLTLAEQSMIEFVVSTKPGVKSKHSYMLDVLQRALRADIKELINEDVEFGDPK